MRDSLRCGAVVCIDFYSSNQLLYLTPCTRHMITRPRQAASTREIHLHGEKTNYTIATVVEFSEQCSTMRSTLTHSHTPHHSTHTRVISYSALLLSPNRPT